MFKSLIEASVMSSYKGINIDNTCGVAIRIALGMDGILLGHSSDMRKLIGTELTVYTEYTDVSQRAIEAIREMSI